MRAIVRQIPDSFASALSATLPDPPIDVRLARRQHAHYTAALAACGVELFGLGPDEACPDCVFVEDTAVVIGDVALVTNPGAPSRRAEVEPIAAVLSAWCDVVRMAAPATLDGGDVLHVGDRIFVGRSARTNAAGIAELERVFGSRGFRIVALDLPPGVLHLKCVVSPLDGERVLLAEGTLALDLPWVRVPVAETYAANCVAIRNSAIIADGFPRTRDALEAAGFTTHPVPCGEVRKADGSLTCQSILVE